MFFRKKLPDFLIRLASEEGKFILRDAWDSGCAENYFPLSQQFITQDQPQLCGLSSLTMVLNALCIDPLRQWKGVWRWFSQYNLNGVQQRHMKAMNLRQLQKIAKLNHSDALHFNTEQNEVGSRYASYQLFRDLVHASSRRQGFFMIINHSRPKLGQTGEGHFSPLAAYCPKRDMVLVMDVARFKYPPYWAKTKLIYQSLKQRDQERQPRGFLLITKQLQKMSELCSGVIDIKGQHHNLALKNSPHSAKILEDLSDPVLSSSVSYYLYQRAIRDSKVINQRGVDGNALQRRCEQFGVDREVSQQLLGVMKGVKIKQQQRRASRIIFGF